VAHLAELSARKLSGESLTQAEETALTDSKVAQAYIKNVQTRAKFNPGTGVQSQSVSPEAYREKAKREFEQSGMTEAEAAHLADLALKEKSGQSLTEAESAELAQNKVAKAFLTLNAGIELTQEGNAVSAAPGASSDPNPQNPEGLPESEKPDTENSVPVVKYSQDAEEGAPGTGDQTVRTDAAKDLLALGYDPEAADRLGDIITRELTGEPVTSEERAALEGDPQAHGVLLRLEDAKRQGGAGLNDSEDHGSISYKRPSGFRKGVRNQVWENAKDINGNVIDPVSEKVINPDEPWDMGHKPGFEFRKHQLSARNHRPSRKQFLDEYNNPDHYRPELPSSNRRHVGEDKTDNYFGD